uniref:Uncharacterized protein n=1 Tax=Molossus molossus TaxID=27622 RepID=A0A7J8J1F6_MOLMO|nr:hypothetical protein HJG59_010355 [Molossus molossus]
MHPMFSQAGQILYFLSFLLPSSPTSQSHRLTISVISGFSLYFPSPQLTAKSYQFSPSSVFTSTDFSPSTAWFWVRPLSSLAQTSHRVFLIEVLVHIPLLEHQLLSCPGSSLVTQKNKKRQLRP